MGIKYLGSHLCVITKNDTGKKSNNGIIIIAHGATITGKNFDLEGGGVYFYCPPGDSLITNDYDFLKCWAGNRVYSKIISTGNSKCPDYELSKSISYHASAAAEKMGKKAINKLIKDDPNQAVKENRSNYEAIEKLVTSGNCPYDVVSIRNRWFSDGTTLSYVIKKLKKEGYGYGEFHCCFCRASDGGGDWDVELRKHI
ncbi:putative adhesin [Methylomonas sp. AM2-LC]|uniref:putative adhesin n=1 Tax=Methylomonas sp. AM2-LC TaxID=3153301 RepID=UPI0032674070